MHRLLGYIVFFSVYSAIPAPSERYMHLNGTQVSNPPPCSLLPPAEVIPSYMFLPFRQFHPFFLTLRSSLIGFLTLSHSWVPTSHWRTSGINIKRAWKQRSERRLGWLGHIYKETVFIRLCSLRIQMLQTLKPPAKKLLTPENDSRLLDCPHRTRSTWSAILISHPTITTHSWGWWNVVDKTKNRNNIAMHRCNRANASLSSWFFLPHWRSYIFQWRIMLRMRELFRPLRFHKENGSLAHHSRGMGQ